MGRKNISPKDQLIVWKKDNWHCRYCGRPVFFAPTLKLLQEINPGHKYYHKNGNEKEMLLLLTQSWATVDHITPFSREGPNDIDNYATACWKCNPKYGNKQIGNGKPPLIDIIKSDWDGLSGLYPILSKLIGKEKDIWTKLLS